MSTRRCIYCGKEFDPSRGEGDHILPAALGEFRGDVRFRGQCSHCNNLIGRFEQQVTQSGPEGFYRQIVCPASARLNKRGIGSQRGALGAPGPVHTANMGDYTALVEPSRENALDVFAVDQIVIRDEDGKDHPVRLYPGMSAAQLQDRIAKLNNAKINTIRLECDDANASDFLNLVKAVLPNLKVEAESVTEAGSRKIRGRATFNVKEPYFQALAKLAFHYYLVHSRRGYPGDESMFDEIRHFILNGGDVSRFCEYTNKGRFRPPIGELPSGGGRHAARMVSSASRGRDFG
jgi:hypothetical protein